MAPTSASFGVGMTEVHNALCLSRLFALSVLSCKRVFSLLVLVLESSSGMWLDNVTCLFLGQCGNALGFAVRATRPYTYRIYTHAILHQTCSLHYIQTQTFFSFLRTQSWEASCREALKAAAKVRTLRRSPKETMRSRVCMEISCQHHVLIRSGHPVRPPPPPASCI